MSKYFEYNVGSDLPADAFRISPSQLSRVLDSTSQWYREFLLDEAPAFTGSTASYLGTCVHACAAMHFDNGFIDHAAVTAYITSITDPEVDKAVIRQQYPVMAAALVSGFLSTSKGTQSELFVSTEIAPNIYAAGSIDMYDEKRATVYDFKTMGSLDSARVPTTFPRSYYFQQLCYAYILRKNGHRVDYCKLVYVSRDNTGRISEKTGKPMQDYPSTVNIVTHQITDEDMTIVENTLKLVSDSVALWNSNPELRYIIAQDYRLKLKPAPVLFKD